MKRAALSGAWLAVAVLGLAAFVSGAESPPVQLPPMVVGDASRGPPWLYARGQDFEVVARCSRSTLRDFVRMRVRLGNVLRLVVPPEFLRQSDVPTVYVLYSQDLRKQEDAVLQGMIAAEKARRASTAARPPVDVPLDVPAFGRQIRSTSSITMGGGPVQFLPNQRIEDRDITCGFVYIDDVNFDAADFMLTADSVFSQLSLRTPALPFGVAAGVAHTFSASGVADDHLIFAPMTWVTAETSRELKGDPLMPRVLVPMSDLFAPNAPGTRDLQSLRARVWRSQAALLFRWALEEPGRLRAYWKFAGRLALEPISEHLWQECFGQSSADIRDELSDYLTAAVSKPLLVPLKSLPRTPAIEIREATPLEVARLRGEWERAEIGFVRKRHPEYLARYIEQAKRTLLRAYKAGDRDPRLSAAIGLCLVDGGEEAEAVSFLEMAAAENVVRPRVYAELARLRQRAIVRAREASRPVTNAEIAPILEPLRAGGTQRPALPEIHLQLAQLLRSCTEPPAVADLELLAQGARQFPQNAELAWQTATLLNARGRHSDAREVVRVALAKSPDGIHRAELTRLRDALQGTP